MKKHVMRKMKKSLTLFCALALFAGCGQSNPGNASGTNGAVGSNGSAGSSGSAASSSNPESGQDTTSNDQKGKLVIALSQNAFISDYVDNYFTNYLKDKLNIDMELIMLPTNGSELSTKLSLMTSGTEQLPDVLLTDSLSREAVLNYGVNEIFIPIQKYLADASIMPNYNSIPEDDKSRMEDATLMADGNIYGFTRCEEQTWNKTPHRYFINKAWLDKLNLKVPTTLDELKEVLIAFRDNDPNGNGANDELPIYGRQSGTYGENVLASLMNSFIYWPSFLNEGLILDESGKKVIAPYTTDAWKKGLTWLRDLYKEGLIAPSIFTDDATLFKATLNAETNVVGLVGVGSAGNWADTANNKNFLEMEMIAPFTGPDGVCYSPYRDYTPTQCMYIFSDSKNQELAVKFADACYDVYTGLVARYGIEGQHWSQDPKDLEGLTSSYVELGIYDKITTAILDDIWTENNNVTWRNVTPRYESKKSMETKANIANGREYNPKNPTNLQAVNVKYYVDKHPEKILPILKYTSEETQNHINAITNISPRVNQAMAEFITDTRNIESGWDTYLSELENMGLSTLIQDAQNAFERSQK